MLILICCGVVLVLGIIGAIVYALIDNFSSYSWGPEWLMNISCIFIGIALVVGLIVGAIAFDVHVNKELNYEATLDRRAALIMGIEYVESADVNAAVSVDIFSDVAEFNAELRRTKRWYDNPWLNIFYNELIAENIDYIPIDRGT